MNIQLSLFIITTSNAAQAQELAEKLVSSGLAACVNIIPSIVSVYKWKNKIENENEAIMIVKSRAELFEEIKEFVKLNHSYEVPEIIEIQVKDVEENYYKWVISNTTNE